MGYATATIANAQEYQRILNTKRPVFILFVSEHCPACVTAGPLFDRIARQYPRVRSLVVDCAKTPRHPDVTGTPTLLIYMRGTLMEKLKGAEVLITTDLRKDKKTDREYLQLKGMAFV